MSADELAEAEFNRLSPPMEPHNEREFELGFLEANEKFGEAQVRLALSLDLPAPSSADTIFDEVSRLRAVEKAATALVEHYDDPAVCPDGVRAAELLDDLTDALNGDTP